MNKTLTQFIKDGESQSVEFKTSFQKESLQNWVNQIKTTTQPSIIVDISQSGHWEVLK